MEHENPTDEELRSRLRQLEAQLQYLGTKLLGYDKDSLDYKNTEEGIKLVERSIQDLKRVLKIH